MPTDSHKVAVVIPTVGRTSMDRCLDALNRQTRPADELVIVEDRQRQGPSWARNRGIQRSSGDLIAFIDDDCSAPPDWLARLIAAIDAYRVAGAGGTLTDSDPFLQAVRNQRGWPHKEGPDTLGIVGNTANIVFDRGWLARCHAEDGYIFNERFGRYGSEDHELVLRIRSRGGSMAYVANPVRHMRQVRLPSYLRYTFQRGIGIALLHEAHRHYGRGHEQQQSLLWSGNQNKWQRAIALLREKVIGPTDPGAFPQIRYFVTFWLSQKYLSLGYIIGHLFFVKGLRQYYRSERR